jgi:hypothetical protein
MTDFNQIMKQAQQVQKNIQDAQKKIAQLQVVGTAGGNKVQITMNGQHLAQTVNIDESVLKEDIEVLEDLIVAAINDAAHKVEQKSREQMSSLMGGIDLPPGMKNPFGGDDKQ